MVENEQNDAVTTSCKNCCSTGLGKMEVGPDEEERQFIVENITESSESSCSYENSRSRYAAFIVKHPYVVLLLILVMVVLCACFSLIPQLGAQPLPTFDEPVKGFEARGTLISDRWLSQWNLFMSERDGDITRVPPRCGIENPISQLKIGDAPAICTGEETFSMGKLTVKLVFETKNGQNLFTATNLKSICNLEKRIIRDYPKLNSYCHTPNGSKECCPSWSLGHYVALLNGNSSCLDIDENQVERVKNLLKTCSRFYYNGSLKPDCWNFKRKAVGKCGAIPKSCTRLNAVYNILHYLTDSQFLRGSVNNTFLKYSLVLVPVKEIESFQVDVYESRLQGIISNSNVVLSGYELSRLKYEMFNAKMLEDLYLAAIAMFFIMIILWLYTGSLLITCIVGVIIVSSLIIAYFVYSVVLRMNFFPFLNVLTSVFLVGIAADDAFVYMDIWNQSSREQQKKRSKPPLNDEERNEEFVSITVNTMRHASVSMFVTSFTTSSAFFASLTSDITSIQLFGLYSGLSILCMFFLMITWFPAAVIIQQKMYGNQTCCSRNILSKPYLKGARDIVNKLVQLHQTFFAKSLPRIVIKWRYFWLLLLSLIAAGGFVVSTYKPGLKLPSTQDFQMFVDSHELERYPLHLKKYFHFETTKRSSFPIYFLWGIKPVDNGNIFDPYDTGKLNYDSDFDMTSKEAQRWIISFISRLKKQRFFAKEQPLTKQCFIEEFFTYMRQNCSEGNQICCKNSVFPYNATVFNECLLQMQCLKIKEAQFQGQSIEDGAPLFDKKNRLRAVSLKFDSNVAFTWSYDPADRFWEEVEDWADGEFKNASAVSGWFISKLRYYDLQKSLSTGTFLSMSISLGIAFGVMLLTTRNIYISVFAIITIACTLGCTVGSLVLLGWELNILESVTLSVSVGLSVDFALHYGVAYVLAEEKSRRQDRVSFSLIGMSSAITMAAFTTFITGAIVLSSDVLSYIQIGQFLMIIMSVSWVYATFFFQALCCLCGPENDSGQLTVAKLRSGYQKLRSLCTIAESGEHRMVPNGKGSKEIRVIYIK